MPDLFLSYSRADQALARRFAEGFEREGLSVWWDQSLHPGEAFDRVTERALEEARAVVVLWSRTSVESRWVRAEAMQAHNTDRLVPVMIEACKRPILFELTQTADLTHWNGDTNDLAWRSLVASLKRAAGSPMAVETRIPAAPVAPSRATGIAVMPFANLTGDKQMEYFGDGMAEELLNALARIHGLRVPPRMSSFSFKGRDEDIRGIAKALGVDAVLEGSVRAAGDTIRLTARLADGRSGEQIWSEVYERPFRDIFRLQDELTRAIVGRLQIHLRAEISAPPAAPIPTPHIEAYRLYLQALAEFRKGGRVEMEQSVRLLDQAIEIDPAFAQAYGARVGPKLLLYLRGFGGTLDTVSSAENDALRAISLNPALVEPRGGLAMIQANRGDWMEARANMDALRANGREVELFPSVGFVVTAMGHLRWTDEIVRAVAQQPPTDAGSALQLAMQSFVLGRTADAHRNTEIALALGFLSHVPPMPAVRSMIAVRQGLHVQAAEIMAQGLSAGLKALDAERVIRAVILALSDSAARDYASSELRRLAARANFAGMVPMENVMMLIWQTQLGNLDAAFEWSMCITDAYRAGAVGRGILYWMWIDEMRPFREDPRFQSFTQELGLLDYWRQRGPPDLCTFIDGRLVCR